MGNKARRAARKAKEERRHRQFAQRRLDDVKHAQRLLGEQKGLPALDAIISLGLSDHPSLLAIFKIGQDSKQDTEAILAQNGFARYRVHTFSVEDEQYVHVQPERFGGHMSVITCDDREYRTVICLKVSAAAEGNNGDVIGAGERICCIASLAHELGHVDDFERKKNIIVGEPLDTMKAELHAHEYACGLMAEHSWHLALALYIGQGLPQFINCGSPTIAEAGRRFADSSAIRDYRRVVGDRYLALWPPIT